MKESTIRPMINLGNSIVGVSILAMPYCFKECGVLLGGLLLLVSATLTIWSCNMVLRAAHMKGKQSFESLALAVFGKVGKLFVEVSVIGLNIGSCIAFFVIIGDLAPPIVAQATGLQWSPSVLRAVLLLVLALLVAFPLALLRNIDSLSVISMCSLFFYLTLIVELVFLSRTKLFSGVWWSDINWWRWEGLLKCLPIFSLAFACQTQLFVIYAALPDVSTRRMSTVINGAIITVAMGYGMVALFGYVSFCTDTVKGDILSNFSLSLISQVTRLGFAISVVVSFPLMIFPCRVSINSLLFSKASMEIHVVEPIPQKRFFFITAWIIGFALTVAILIPQVEFVLSMTGATMGSLICYIFPSSLLLYVAGSNTEYRNRARVVFVLGVCVMVLSTVVILGSQPGGGEVEVIPPGPKPDHLDTDKGAAQLPGVGDIDPGVRREEEKPDGGADETEDKRHEPPQPQAPVKEDDRGGGGGEKEGGGGEKVGGGGEKEGGGGEKEGGGEEKAGDDGVKVGGKEGGGGEEKNDGAHQDIRQQMNELHERLQKVEGENKQLKEWQKEQQEKDQLKMDTQQAVGGGDRGPLQGQELAQQQPVVNAKDTPQQAVAQDPVIQPTPIRNPGDQLLNLNAKAPIGNIAPAAKENGVGVRETRDLGQVEDGPAPTEVPAVHAGEGHNYKKQLDAGSDVDNNPGQQAVDNNPGQQAVDNNPGQQAVDNNPGQQAVDNNPGQQALDNNPGKQAEKVQEPAVQRVVGNEVKSQQDGTKEESEKEGQLEDQVLNQLRKPAGTGEEATKAVTSKETEKAEKATESTTATVRLDREEARVPARELKNVSEEARTR